MHLSNYLDDVVVWAPAKVNLFLEVLGKRLDGYHEIATLMVAVRLYDTLVFHAELSPALCLHCSDSRLATGPENLVVRSARLLQDRTGCKRGATIRLAKRIPMGAGLGGGSTDAAATLLGLNRLWQLGLSGGDLARLGGEIGSDVPFFFDTPAAWCTGRGEIVTSVKSPMPLNFVLLCPDFAMSTAEVYKKVVVPLAPITGEAIRRELQKGDVDSIGQLLHNRLQLAAETLEPRVAEYARLLAEAKPAGFLMSGSGSTLYALCRSADEAGSIAASLKARFKARGEPADLKGKPAREREDGVKLIVTRTV
jgi:4-diphosphocytidyl-2-C-methyl-D-erythritol kinase